VKLDLQPVALGELIGEAVARMRPQAEDAGLDLGSEVNGRDSIIMVDRDRIGHVFDNLIVNAIRHTPRGGAIRVAAGPDGDGVRVDVRDTGRGIADEHLPRLFEKFYRIPGESAPGGAGLGLAIVREIVTAHGGRIDVASRPGKGTTFTFVLPGCHAAPDSSQNQGSLSCTPLIAS
jgi:signal transduction histidine kinase